MDMADYGVALQIFEEENSIADVADALWGSGLYCVVILKICRKEDWVNSCVQLPFLGNSATSAKEIAVTLDAGFEFWLFTGLLPEGKREYVNVLRIGEKLDVFAELAQASSRLLEAFLMRVERKLRSHCLRP